MEVESSIDISIDNYNESEYIKQLRIYRTECENILADLRNKSSINTNEYNAVLNIYNTWLLLEILESVENDDNNIINDPFHEYFDIRVLRNRLISESKELSREYAIVEWLQIIASNENTNSPIKFPNYTSHYNKTLQSLYSQTKKLTSFDPDYSRDGTLVTSDENEDNIFLNTIYNLFRQGRMDDALLYCSDSKMNWRLVSILGHLLQHIELNNSVEGDVVEGITGNSLLNGNKNYFLWKACCYKLSQKCQSAEAALYGVLGGNVEPVLEYCNNTWMDYLWALLANSCRNKVDKMMQDYLKASGRVELVITENINFTTCNFKEIFEQIENADTESDMFDCFRLIQKYFIENKPLELIEYLSNVFKKELSNSNNNLSDSFYSFVVHLAILLRDKNENSSDIVTYESFSKIIIETYISYLIKTNRNDLVASYCKYLPEKDQVKLFVEFLSHVQLQKRIALIDASCPSHLSANVGNQIVLELVKKIVVDDDEISMVSLKIGENKPFDINISSKDLEKVQSLMLLISSDILKSSTDSYTSLSNYLILYANYLFRQFLLCNNIKAASLLKKSISESTKCTQIFIECATSPIKDLNESYLEYNCWSEYLNFLNQKVDNINDIDNLRSNFFNLLTTPGFWDNNLGFKSRESNYISSCYLESTKFWNNRNSNLNILRSKCIYNIFELWYIRLTKFNLFKEATEIANLFSSEDYKLYTAFSKDELSNFISLLRKSFIMSDHLIESLNK